MKAEHKDVSPSSWPAANAIVDDFMKEAVPVLKEALADLNAIPSDWSDCVLVSADEYPVDEDVYLDVADVLYARAGIEAAIGLAYFAHGYDLTVDWKKAKAARDYELTVPLVKSTPSMDSKEGWDAGIVSGEGGAMVLMSGTKLYLRFDNAPYGMGYGWMNFENVKTGKSVGVDCWSFDGLEAYACDSGKTVGLGVEEFFNDDESYVLVVDLSAKRELLANGTWAMTDGYAEIRVGKCYDESWDEYYYTYEYPEMEFDESPAVFGQLLAEQTKFMAKVRNPSSLATSKTWMTAALTCALNADAAVQNRTDDAMHFIEYDPIDAADIEKARNLTQKALNSLAEPQEVDVQGEVLSGRETKFDVSLLPNDGLMQVYLGALFEGKITRDLLPTFQKGANEGPVPVIETIKDPTLAGLLPDFAAKTWSHLVQGMGHEVAHQTVSLKLDGNGGKLPKGAPTAISLDFDEESEECHYPELPVPDRAGFIFTGWTTAKAGGTIVRKDDVYDASLFAGAKTPTLYAQWLKLYTFTVKGEGAGASWDWSEEQADTLPQEAFAGEYEMEVNDKGTMDVPEGAVVYVWAEEQSKDNKGNPLAFQKWTVSSAKASLGPDFRVTSYDTQLVMPAEKLTLTATYIDGSMCGSLSACAYASDVEFGWNAETEKPYTIEPPYEAFEWSPDGGKTWYKAKTWCTEGEAALLKAGAYTVTWRSADPSWQAPSSKTKTTVAVGEENELDCYFTFTYIPQVVVDVMTFENGELQESAAAGTVTMNPKDGLAPVGKAIALTAKAAKGYAFQGWTLADDWTYDDGFWEAAATWKFENSEMSVSQSYFSLNEFIDPADQKVHVKAIFKAFTAYGAGDIVFNGIGSYGFGGYDGYYSKASDGVVSIRAVVGCALDNLKIDCGLAASPLAYKLDGKLPDGLKFDAKTGVLSGAPKKAGNTSVTITATDPAKNANNLMVNFAVDSLPSWLVGEYRGSTSSGNFCCGFEPDDDEDVKRPQNGLLELSVKSDGKVSAKLLTSAGARSVSGTLSWTPDEEYPEAEGAFTFSAKMTKDDEECEVEFWPDGTISGYANSYNKAEGKHLGGDVEGRRQDTEILSLSNFLDKYYTFAFCAETTRYVGNHDEGQYQLEESKMKSGYGYLTLKTDKKGVAKVTGQLPDGEKVSMSALVLPYSSVMTCCGLVPSAEKISARLFLFASPSSYKKLDWFAMALTIAPGGKITTDENAAWTPANGDDDGVLVQGPLAQVSGRGALYSEAKSLEDYYWTVSCEWNENVRQQYSYKEYYEDDNGKTAYEMTYEYADAQNFFDGVFFNVTVKGDKKGAISLAKKSPAPWEESWKEDGVTYKKWNYETDKNGNPITDPSQLSISFTKATGIFTGKASVYFDYWLPSYKQNSKTKEIEYSETLKHVTASLPYAGVMIAGEKGYAGFGSAVYTYKHLYEDCSGKAKTSTEKVTLPVTLESSQADDEEP